MTLEQQIANAIAISGLYVMFAVGFMLIYSVLRIIHIAHGSVIVVGAYSNYFLFLLTRNFVISALISMLIAGAAGALIEELVYRPVILRWGTGLFTLVASIGVHTFVDESFLVIVGAVHKGYPEAINTITLNIFGTEIILIHLITVALSLVSTLSLYTFLMKTRSGLALRAVAQDLELAAVRGINPRKTALMAMIIGSVFAGLAGTLLSLRYNWVYPAIGDEPIIISFAAVILGGMGSITGAVLASFILGFTETFAFAFLPVPFTRTALGFIAVIVTLLIRPQGLFGRKK